MPIVLMNVFFIDLLKKTVCIGGWCEAGGRDSVLIILE